MRGDEGPPRFWQPRFYDFNVYSAKKKREKLEYMHANPVTRGSVQHPKDWPWSSFSFYTKGETGLVAIDPVGCGVRTEQRGNEEGKSKPRHAKPTCGAPNSTFARSARTA